MNKIKAYVKQLDSADTFIFYAIFIGLAVYTGILAYLIF